MMELSEIGYDFVSETGVHYSMCCQRSAKIWLMAKVLDQWQKFCDK